MNELFEGMNGQGMPLRDATVGAGLCRHSTFENRRRFWLRTIANHREDPPFPARHTSSAAVCRDCITHAHSAVLGASSGSRAVETAPTKGTKWFPAQPARTPPGTAAERVGTAAEHVGAPTLLHTPLTAPSSAPLPAAGQLKLHLRKAQSRPASAKSASHWGATAASLPCTPAPLLPGSALRCRSPAP